LEWGNLFSQWHISGNNCWLSKFSSDLVEQYNNTATAGKSNSSKYYGITNE
jgi:hypothetical protein